MRLIEENVLKPCPFCGGEVTMIYNSFDKEFKIYHTNHDCYIDEPFILRASTRVNAKRKWNRRASDDN